MSSLLNNILKINSSTFSNEQLLPKLPIPTLESTLKLYLLSVKATSNSGYDNLERKVNQFLKSKEAEKLQAYLLWYFNKTDCWLYDWWLTESYLKNRSPLIPNLNITGGSSLHEKVWLPISTHQIDSCRLLFNPIVLTRCATYIYGLLKYYLILRHEYLVPSISRNKRKLSMHQFRFLFNTCRIPGEFEDTIVNKFRVTSEGPCPENVIISCCGHIFNLDLSTRSESVYAIEFIAAALNEIVEYCTKKVSIGSCVSSLTSLPRSDWAKLRMELLNESMNNQSILSQIEQSLFWINLDVTAPPDELDCLPERALKVDTRNIWADKSLYFSFSKNGLMTWGVDHTSLDGITLISSLSIIENMIKHENGTIKCENINVLKTEDIYSPINWNELKFDIPNKIKFQILTAYYLYQSNCNKLKVKIIKFKRFNRKYLRKLKFHPDTVFQLCLQLAYARMFGINNLASVYETATTRYFRLGRTETIRSCTLESVNWIKSVIFMGSEHHKTVQLFLLAHKAHNQLREKCESGLGCDRHLLGLSKASYSSDNLRSPLLEEIIQDSTWVESGGNGSFKLSTSPVGASDINIGVAPMNNGKFGVFYRILEEFTEVVITYWNENTSDGAVFLKYMNESFLSIPIITLSANL